MRTGGTTAWLVGMPKSGSAPPVRAACRADLDAVSALAIAFYSEEGFATPADELRSNLDLLLASTAARTAVAVLGDEPVGFAITTTSFGLESGLVAELEDLYVAPAARRQGIAGRLIEDSARWARRRGCRYLELVIAPNSTRDLDSYYRNRGFQDHNRRLVARDL